MGKDRGGRDGRRFLSRVALDLTVAGGHGGHGRSSAAAFVRARDSGERRRNGARVTGGAGRSRFCSAEERARPSIAIDGQRRPAVARLD
jgi:hypothetical protein